MDEKTKARVCDGIMRARGIIMGLMNIKDLDADAKLQLGKAMIDLRKREYNIDSERYNVDPSE